MVNAHTTSANDSEVMGSMGNYCFKIVLNVYQSILKLFKVMSAFSFLYTSILTQHQRRVFKTASAFKGITVQQLCNLHQ